MSIRKRQENELWNLRVILEGGCHDDGTPLTEGEKDELRGFIANMERILGVAATETEKS